LQDARALLESGTYQGLTLQVPEPQAPEIVMPDRGSAELETLNRLSARRAQEVAFAKDNAVVAQDVVRGGGVKIEVGQDEGREIDAACQRHLLATADWNADDGFGTLVDL